MNLFSDRRLRNQFGNLVATLGISAAVYNGLQAGRVVTDRIEAQHNHQPLNSAAFHDKAEEYRQNMNLALLTTLLGAAISRANKLTPEAEKFLREEDPKFQNQGELVGLVAVCIMSNLASSAIRGSLAPIVEAALTPEGFAENRQKINLAFAASGITLSGLAWAGGQILAKCYTSIKLRLARK